MKILEFVCDGAPGGGTNHVMQLLRGLPDRFGRALLTQKDSYLANEASKLGIEVHTGDFFRSRIDRAAVARVQEIVDQVQPDLIHNHGGRAAFYYSWTQKRVPSIYTVHGFHFARKSLVPRIAGRWGEVRNIDSADKVIFVSHHDAALAKEHKLIADTKPYRVIHNGILSPVQPTTKEKLGVGFIGRLVPQKNPELFIEMMQHLPGVNAVIVGGGELEDGVAHQINDQGLQSQIRCYGSLGHKEALEVLANLDVLVMTPRWEGLPLLPLEAMLLKVPVVSTAVGGIPEVIDHMKHGMLVHDRSGQSLADCVSLLLENDSLRQQIVDDAYQRALTDFSQQQMLNELSETYMQTLETVLFEA